MKSGSCQEHGIAIIIPSCSQPYHKKTVTKIVLLMTAGHVCWSVYGGFKKVIRQWNFFYRESFHFSNLENAAHLESRANQVHKLQGQ